MYKIIFTTILFLIIMITSYFYIFKNPEKSKTTENKDDMFFLILIIITGCIVKFAGSLFYYERGDMGAFISWMNNLQKNGFAGFYTKYGLCYPPLHIFLLYITGLICTLFNIGNHSTIQILLIKSPALICDILTGLLLYKIGKKHISSKLGLAACAIYLFNPAIFFNSAVWGQMDSIYTFCIVLMCCLISEKKLKQAYFAFAASILFKYQGVIFTPIIIFAIIDQVILDNCTAKKFFSHLFTGLSAIAAMLACHLPFVFGNGMASQNADTITSAYGEALTAFKYASVNAYNFWAMLGLNWHTQEDTFLSITYNTWGTIAIVLLVAAAFAISMRAGKADGKYYVTAAFIMSTMFLFSVRMHERYLFAAIPLLFAAFLAKPCIEIFIAYCGITLMNFYNCIHVLFYYNYNNYDPKNPVIILTSAGTLLFWLVFVLGILRQYFFKKRSADIF